MSPSGLGRTLRGGLRRPRRRALPTRASGLAPPLVGPLGGGALFVEGAPPQLGEVVPSALMQRRRVACRHILMLRLGGRSSASACSIPIGSPAPPRGVPHRRCPRRPFAFDGVGRVGMGSSGRGAQAAPRRSSEEALHRQRRDIGLLEDPVLTGPARAAGVVARIPAARCVSVEAIPFPAPVQGATSRAVGGRGIASRGAAPEGSAAADPELAWWRAGRRGGRGVGRDGRREAEEHAGILGRLLVGGSNRFVASRIGPCPRVAHLGHEGVWATQSDAPSLRRLGIYGRPHPPASRAAKILVPSAITFAGWFRPAGPLLPRWRGGRSPGGRTPRNTARAPRSTGCALCWSSSPHVPWQPAGRGGAPSQAARRLAPARREPAPGLVEPGCCGSRRSSGPAPQARRRRGPSRRWSADPRRCWMTPAGAPPDHPPSPLTSLRTPLP